MAWNEPFGEPAHRPFYAPPHVRRDDDGYYFGPGGAEPAWSRPRRRIIFNAVSVKEESRNEESVTVRLYGPNTKFVIDREREFHAIKYLWAAGFGAKLLAVFGNGMVQSFINARTLTPEDMRKPKLVAEIAKQLHKFHQVEIPGCKEPQLWNDIFKFFEKASDLKFDDNEKRRKYETISFKEIHDELLELKGLCTGIVILLTRGMKSSHLLVFSEDLFFIYLLPPIIFNAGFQVKKKQFFRNFMTIMLFGAIGTLLSCTNISQEPQKFSKDRYEQHMQVNHLALALLSVAFSITLSRLSK